VTVSKSATFQKRFSEITGIARTELPRVRAILSLKTVPNRLRLKSPDSIQPGMDEA
jgi:hypothetical protein